MIAEIFGICWYDALPRSSSLAKKKEPRNTGTQFANREALIARPIRFGSRINRDRLRQAEVDNRF
jgi:hypothetical protein